MDEEYYNWIHFSEDLQDDEEAEILRMAQEIEDGIGEGQTL
jgi:hypothetical protein